MTLEIVGEQKKKLYRKRSRAELNRELSSLSDNLSVHYQIPKKTLSGTDLEHTPKRSRKDRHSASDATTSEDNAAAGSAGSARVGKKQKTGSKGGQGRQEMAGKGSGAEDQRMEDGETEPRSAETGRKGGGDRNGELGGENSVKYVASLVDRAVDRVIGSGSESSGDSTDELTSPLERKRRRTGEVEHGETARALAGQLAGLTQLVQSLVSQGNAAEQKLETLVKQGNTTEQTLAELDGKIERKVATLRSSLEERMTRGEEQARKNKEELAGNAEEVGATVRSLERKLDEVKATQSEGDKEVKASLDRLRKDNDQLKTNYNALTKRVRMGNVQRKVSVDLDSAEERENRRKVLVRGLCLGRVEEGSESPEERDKLALVEAIRQRMPRVMGLEGLEAARGLSSPKLIDAIIRAVRVGGEALEDRPLLVSFRSERDAQLVLSEAERYKDGFRALLRKHRDKGNDDPRPKVLWIDEPQTRAVRSEFQRLRKKQKELNAHIETQPPDARGPFVRLDRRRMCLTQEGRTEAETLECAKSYGVDLEYDSPPKRELSHSDRLRRREADDAANVGGRRGLNSVGAVVNLEAEMDARHSQVSQITQKFGGQKATGSTNGALPPTGVGAEMQRVPQNIYPGHGLFNSQHQHAGFWATQGSGGMLGGTPWGTGHH